MTSLYALGWTQHTVGSQNIRAIACIQLLLGNMGLPGGGVNALRGHSNIQGLTDLGVMSHLLPGYLGLPTEKEPDLKTYLEKRTPKAVRPGQMNYLQNYPEVLRLAAQGLVRGRGDQKENDFCFDWLPKNDKTYDILASLRADVSRGRSTGTSARASTRWPRSRQEQARRRALAKLKYLVVIDPLVTETSTFWKNKAEFNEVDSKAIQTEVFRLPSTCFAEEDGSLTNSGRQLQWHWKAAEPPGEAKGDLGDHGADLPGGARPLQEGGRHLPGPHRQDALALRQGRRPVGGRAGPRGQRQGAGRHPRPQGQDQDPGQGGRAARHLRPPAGRRHHLGRLLDLHRQLDPERQPDGEARRLGSDRPRQHARLGLVVAGQPPHPLQPRLGRSGRQGLGRHAQVHLLERQEVGRAPTSPTSRSTHRPRRACRPSS